MKLNLSVLLMGTMLVIVSGCAIHPQGGEVRVHDRDYDVRVVFSDPDRRIIREYYRSDYRGLPPGLAKKGKVPPGHAFKLRRNQGVPANVEWAYLPTHIESRLSRLPDGYIRIVVGGDVAILNTRTRIVVDLLENLND